MTARAPGLTRLLGFLSILLALSGCARDAPVFTPPAQRALAPGERPWPQGQFLTISYHDVQDADPDQAYVSVRTDHLREQIAWLHAAGYQAVSVDQILAARDGGPPLPEKAVLLTFDDGYRSFYSHVFPLLKAYGWPSLLAPVGTWMDTPRGVDVDFGGLPTDRERFLYWRQIRELAASGLVEVGAHTDNLHYGIPANPQGNLQPAPAVLAFDAATNSYETDTAYRRRIEADVESITRKIARETGKRPRVWVWPYGVASGTALDIVKAHGYRMALTLQDGAGSIRELMNVPRLLVADDPPLRSYVNAVHAMERKPTLRAVHVDLDYVYDPDPEQMDRNLGNLVQRIADMQISAVFLQAFADPEGDGLVRSVYFPNRRLPMRADLFNRAAWQLRNRAHVGVYAWMPVLAFDLDPGLARVKRWDPRTGATAIDPEKYARLSPFDPEARRQIIELYEDLSRHAVFDGLLFHDDALLSDFEDAGPQALQAYRRAGLGDGIAALRANPESLRRWTRFKSRALVGFTQTLAKHVRAIRGPQVKTARNMFALPIIDPDSESWFAQNLDDFLQAYDWTAPMAMPLMEDVPEDGAGPWLDRLVDAVAARPGALDRTIFEIQGRDWRPASDGGDRGHVDSALMARWLKRLQLRGARNLGYYPDDFVQNQPRLDIIRPAISNAWYPY